MHPSPPWNLKGFAYQTLHPIEVDRARSFIPRELDIFSILPDKTLGGVYVSSYQSGSVLEYNELIVVPGLVRYKDKIGAWVSHIYVDNPDSVEGGREIWGLPKELASFTWEKGNSQEESDRVLIRQGDRLLCSFSYDWRFSFWRQKLTGFAFGHKNADLLHFKAKAEANWAIVGSHLTIPPESPFADLNLGQPMLTASANSLDLLIEAPQAIAQLTLPQVSPVS